MNPVKTTVVALQTAARQPQAAPVPVSSNESADVVRTAAFQGGAQVTDPATAAQRAEAAPQSRAQQRERLNAALEAINEQASSFSPALKFEPDADSGVVIIKVMNRSTGEVIRQLPPEAVVKASEEGTVPALVAETV